MKKILSILFIFSALLLFTGNIFAQKVVVVNGDEHSTHTLKTTDSAYHYIDSVVIADNEAGVIEVTVIGFSYDTTKSVTGKKIVRYNKDGGTLTMGTATDDLATETDTALGSATWTLVAANNKIYVRIKGKNTYTFQWLSVVKRKSVYL